MFYGEANRVADVGDLDATECHGLIRSATSSSSPFSVKVKSWGVDVETGSTLQVKLSLKLNSVGSTREDN